MLAKEPQDFFHKIKAGEFTLSQQCTMHNSIVIIIARAKSQNVIPAWLAIFNREADFLRRCGQVRPVLWALFACS